MNSVCSFMQINAAAHGFSVGGKKWLSLFTVCVTVASAEAATVTNAISGGWATTTTWVGNMVPAATDNVVIVTNTTVFLSGAVSQSGVITINAGGTLSDGGNKLVIANGLNPGMIVDGTFRITVDDGLDKGGTTPPPTVRVNSGGVIDFSTTAARTGVSLWDLQPGSTIMYSSAGITRALDSSIPTYANLTLSGTGAKLLSGNTTVNGTLSLQGTATFNRNGKALTYGNNAVLEYKGSAAQTATDEFPATMNAAVVIDNPSGVRISAARTLNKNLTLSRGTFTLAATLALGNGVTVTRAAGSLSAAPTFGATVNVSYTGTSGVTAGNELPAATGALNNLTVSYDAPATLTLNANRTVNGVLTIGSNATLADGGFTLTAKGNVSNSGTHGGAGKILLAGTSQTLSGAGTYGNLNVKAGGTLAPGSSPGTLTFTGALTLESGATFAVEVSGASSGQAVVGGTASLGGAALSVTGSGPTASSYPIITANSVVGQFVDRPEGASVTVGDNPYFIHYGETAVTLTASARLTGYVFRDNGTPRDGLFNSGDEALSEVDVKLFTNGVEAATYTTGSDGKYVFAGLKPGAVTLKILMNGGSVTTNPDGTDARRNRALSDGTDAYITTTVAAGDGVLSEPETLNFGLYNDAYTAAEVLISAYAAAGGVVVEFQSIEESGGNDMIVYLYRDGRWIEVGRQAAVGEGNNRYTFNVPGVSAGEVCNLMVRDDEGQYHVAYALTVNSFAAEAVLMEKNGLWLQWNSQPDRTYEIHRALLPGGPWQAVKSVTAVDFKTRAFASFEPGQPTGFFKIVLVP